MPASLHHNILPSPDGGQAISANSLAPHFLRILIAQTKSPYEKNSTSLKNASKLLKKGYSA